MVDPGAVGSDQTDGQHRHWLVNGATITGERPSRPCLTELRVISFRQMARSPLMAPPRSPNTQDPLLLLALDRTGQCMSAFHLSCLPFQRDRRYTIVVYAQGDDFTPPQNLSAPVQGVQLFDFPAYVKSTNLGPLVAGIYYQTEEGTASVSIPATSSVVSSTLPAARSSSGASSGTSSGPRSTSTSTNNNSGGVTGKAISGSFLGLAAVLSYIML